MSGTIPTTLGRLTKLKRLVVESNILTGTIPTELGLLVDLERLYIHKNQLTGSIPPQLGNLTKLKELYLNNNRVSGGTPGLSGTIPTTLGGLTKLKKLIVGTNELTGTIPTELGNLANLEDLRMEGNQFSNALDGRAIPDDLCTALFVTNPIVSTFKLDNDAGGIISITNETECDEAKFKFPLAWVLAPGGGSCTGACASFEGGVVTDGCNEVAQKLVDTFEELNYVLGDVLGEGICSSASTNVVGAPSRVTFDGGTTFFCGTSGDTSTCGTTPQATQTRRICCCSDSGDRCPVAMP